MKDEKVEVYIEMIGNVIVVQDAVGIMTISPDRLKIVRPLVAWDFVNLLDSKEGFDVPPDSGLIREFYRALDVWYHEEESSCMTPFSLVHALVFHELQKYCVNEQRFQSENTMETMTRSKYILRSKEVVVVTARGILAGTLSEDVSRTEEMVASTFVDRTNSHVGKVSSSNGVTLTFANLYLHGITHTEIYDRHESKAAEDILDIFSDMSKKYELRMREEKV